jgi:murein DD-endopeptidase MepM/ murein hydrolase activator NlpD
MNCRWLVKISALTFFSIPHSGLTTETNSALLKEWKTVDTKIRNLSAKETELLNQKISLELAVSETTENIKLLTDVINEKRNFTMNRIRYLNQDSGADLLRHLLESSNPGELERNHKFFMIASRLDVDLIRQYNRDIIRLENERQKYSMRISKLNELHRELKNQSESFVGELKNKGLILNKIRRRLKSNSKSWTHELKQALLSKNTEKANLYQSLLNKNFIDRKGQLTSPTDANVKFNFGVIKLDPLAPVLPFHGVLFDSQQGSNVRAMADGTVAWIGNIPGLGQAVILDHGRDLHSVYARVQLAKLAIGDMIEEGATLGRVVFTNHRLGTGLYFEVRERALPSDPLRWVLTKSELFSKEFNQWENVQ